MANILKRNAGNAPMTFNGLVDNVFQNSLNRFFDDDNWGFRGLTHTQRVPVNLRETATTYEMQLVAPGLRKEDFNISVDNKMLTVSFEHRAEEKEENKEEGWLRREYGMQSFSRSFQLDETVNAEGITARYADGMLCLSIPKKEGAQKISKTVEVK
ncbi:Hsp20/alpha crystallin family protein [Paraflavisolibacter sp. H34]|uniref:Hsp20/alpha crystallin family protein n=1 Tax=Huijunlia imazamoxiresistens TaxID=3127457 RepID=UPI00301766DF